MCVCTSKCDVTNGAFFRQLSRLSAAKPEDFAAISNDNNNLTVTANLRATTKKNLKNNFSFPRKLSDQNSSQLQQQQQEQQISTPEFFDDFRSCGGQLQHQRHTQTRVRTCDKTVVARLILVARKYIYFYENISSFFFCCCCCCCCCCRGNFFSFSYLHFFLLANPAVV